MQTSRAGRASGECRAERKAAVAVFETAMMFGAITLHQSGEREISSSPCSTAAASPTAGGPGLALVRNVRWAVTVCRLVEPSALVAGYGLYYPERRLASPALRALIEHLRRWRASARGGKRSR
jgi:DNA-binding transcriptional LysR family regulator